MNPAKTQIAYKVHVNDILAGRIVEGDETQPSHIAIRGKKVSKASVIGVIVSKDNESQGIFIDDGTGTIRVRSFGEEKKDVTPLQAGDVATVIGRIRAYNDEKYLSPEIIAKSTERMMRLRMLELEKDALTKNSNIRDQLGDSIEEEVIAEEEDYSAAMLVRNTIREIDISNNGSGADMEEISRKSNLPHTEDLIKRLLQAGEIFEIRPGKVKVLE